MGVAAAATTPVAAAATAPVAASAAAPAATSAATSAAAPAAEEAPEFEFEFHRRSEEEGQGGTALRLRGCRAHSATACCFRFEIWARWAKRKAHRHLPCKEVKDGLI